MRGKKRPKFNSIRTTMILSFTALIFMALVILATINYRQGQNMVFTMVMDYVTQLNEQINTNIDSYITYMENVSQIEVNNEYVKYCLFAEEEENLLSLRENYLNNISSQFAVLKNTRKDIHNIGILGNNGSYLVNNRQTKINPYVEYRKLDWYVRALEGKSILTTSHVQNIVADDYQWVVTLCNGIVNSNTGRIEGVFFIDLNYSSISSLCESIDLGNRGYVFIVDDNGDIVYHPKQQLIYSGVLKENIDEILENDQKDYLTRDGEKFYFMVKSAKTGWTVVGVTYKSEMMEQMDKTKNTYVILTVAVLVLTTICAVIISNAITKPIKKLQKSMKQVEKGDFDIQLGDSEYIDEIGHLQNSFKIMIYKIRQLIEHNIAEQEAKRKSELRALQAQINPHFLYNTLDSIIWTTESNKTEEAIRMTSALSKLLRKSISNEDELVSIDREIDYVKDYLTIQKMRYQDKLEYDIDIDTEILNVKIVKLVLQPLVENAIYHGIKYKNSKGLIRISGRIEGQDVIIRIEDNGMGMDEEALSHIFDKNPTQTSKKVGVHNVHNRLQLYYGKNYGLRYESKLGEGTTVSIVIPYEI